MHICCLVRHVPVFVYLAPYKLQDSLKVKMTDYYAICKSNFNFFSFAIRNMGWLFCCRSLTKSKIAKFTSISCACPRNCLNLFYSILSNVVDAHYNFILLPYLSYIVELGGVQYCETLVQALSAEQKPTLPDIHRFCCQSASQLLGSLLKIKRLRPFCKEVNHTVTDSF